MDQSYKRRGILPILHSGIGLVLCDVGRKEESCLLHLKKKIEVNYL